MNEQQKEDLRKIQEQENKGNIFFAGIEIMSSSLDEFIKQPVEGILYDLNRDKVTTISLADTNDNMRLRWINDYAVAVVIEKLKSETDKYRKALEDINERHWEDNFPVWIHELINEVLK
jgi:hypothetical protein